MIRFGRFGDGVRRRVMLLVSNSDPTVPPVPAPDPDVPPPHRPEPTEPPTPIIPDPLPPKPEPMVPERPPELPGD